MKMKILQYLIQFKEIKNTKSSSSQQPHRLCAVFSYWRFCNFDNQHIACNRIEEGKKKNLGKMVMEF